MTVINNVIELIGTKSIKSLDDLRVEAADFNQRNHSRRQSYLKRLSYVEEQLLDRGTRAFMERQRIPQELGYFLAYLYHIERMNFQDLTTFVYEKTGESHDTFLYNLFRVLDIPVRNRSETVAIKNNRKVNFSRLKNKSPLTAREFEVLKTKFLLGATIRDTAYELGIAFNTVNNHLTSIYNKLNVFDFTGAVMEAYRRGILTVENMSAEPPSYLKDKTIRRE